MANNTRENVLAMDARRHGAAQAVPGGRSISGELVVARDPLQLRAEELRALRTRILIRWAQTGVRRRILVVASPGPAEGRSYVAANLALAFAQLGERTLLIDADLRAPRQQRIFDAPEQPGLTAVLSGRAGHGAVLALPEFGGLSLLTAGAQAANPQELLLGPALARLLDELATEFDSIVCDSPPAANCADAQSLAFRAGSALVIARKDRTRIGDAQRTVRELSATGARIVGTVFNAF
ncbi:MAG: CpsD/CapB family tyrosine-protein kinase [Burkholderiales bacterium]